VEIWVPTQNVVWIVMAASLGKLGGWADGAGRILGPAEASGVGFSIGRIEKTTSRELARARLLEWQQAAAAVRKARERANIGHLTELPFEPRRPTWPTTGGLRASRNSRLRRTASARGTAWPRARHCMRCGCWWRRVSDHSVFQAL